MAKYTIELKDVIASGVNIFDFNYEFYDNEKRPKFEQDFIRHFYFREIGSETIDRFKLHLQDVFATVFPYYNTLFDATRIEYDKLNNYNVTETHEITRNDNKKSDNVTSGVSQVFDEQSTDVTGNVKNTGSQNITDYENGNHKTNTKTSNTDSENIERVTNTETSHSDETETNTNVTAEKSGVKKDVKKFSDTPQSKLNLDGTEVYITTLNQDETTDTDEQSSDTKSNTDNSGTSSTETDESGEVTKTGTGTTDTTVTDTTSKNGTVKSNDTSETEQKTEHHGSQKSTGDSNTRTSETGLYTEKFELNRFGNIGVQTGSDMVEKHIALQKTLSNIQKMFFDECEILFMGVY